MIYHHIALNSPLPPLTYAHDTALPPGSRVLVSLRGQKQVGIVWATAVQPDIAPDKILPIETVLDEGLLPDAWRELVGFAARYYHYPVGQTAFTALPAALKEHKPAALPAPPIVYTLSEEGKKQPAPPARHTKQAAFWHALQHGGADMAALKNIHAQAASLLQKYTERGWIAQHEKQPAPIPPSSHTLNDEQRRTADTIAQSLGQFGVFLLYGITGSGKTEVYFDVMAKVLAEGRQVLFLLPEINLTPQLLHRIAQRFPNVPTAVLHSQTAAAQRSQDYLRALLGHAKLIVGTRLSVFTPMADLGLLIVDEEHDDSFKQDSDLRYNARNLAVWRAKQSGCPIVLGSATPSLESWHKAKTGAYTLLSLPHRANPAAKLPEITLLNTGRLPLENGFSPQALSLLKDNLQRGGMSLVYLNRRGFAPALFCGDCGHTFGCPHCSAKMVLHQRARQLRCHHCDFRQPIPHACSECGNQDLTAVGQGTQRAEETLRSLLPQARIARVDRDSTSRKNDWADLYAQIDNHQIDILVGTQMLAKGHDFPRLNLVVVLNADGALFSSDFRAPEHLFAELMQVAGRAGRAEHAGRVLIQTRLPDNPVFAAVKAQDYALFADHESAQRELLNLPPFGFQAAVRADAPQLSEATEWLNRLRDTVAAHLPEHVYQFGAVPMAMARLAARERAQVFVESTDRNALHQALHLWAHYAQQTRNHRIRWHIDVDCVDM